MKNDEAINNSSSNPIVGYAKKLVKQIFGLIWVGVVLTLSAFGIFAVGVIPYQLLQWLKNGYWTPMPFTVLLNYFGIDYHPIISTSWVGFNSIANSFVNAHITFCIFVIFIIGLLLVAYTFEIASKILFPLNK
jgi:hypothetical protein